MAKKRKSRASQPSVEEEPVPMAMEDPINQPQHEQEHEHAAIDDVVGKELGQEGDESAQNLEEEEEEDGQEEDEEDEETTVNEVKVEANGGGGGGEEKEDLEDEPVEKLLGPFSKERLEGSGALTAVSAKRSKTSEAPTGSSGESDARTYVNVDDDDEPSQTERPRPMDRDAAERVLASELSVIAALNNSLINRLKERQREIDFQFYLSPHNHLSGVRLEITLQEKERVRQRYGWDPLE